MPKILKALRDKYVTRIYLFFLNAKRSVLWSHLSSSFRQYDVLPDLVSDGFRWSAALCCKMKITDCGIWNGSCSPEILHGVVLSPDYDGPSGTPFVGALHTSNWHAKLGAEGDLAWEKLTALTANDSQSGGSHRPRRRMDNRRLDGARKLAVMGNGLMGGIPWSRVVIISDFEGTSGLLRLPLFNSAHQSCQPPAEGVFKRVFTL